MSPRRQIAAWLHIVTGVFIAGGVSMLWVFAAMLAPIFEGSFIPELVEMFGRPFAIALIGFGVLEVAAAVALLLGREWARVAILIVSVFHLLAFPIGTALAIFTAWAVMSTRDERRPGNGELDTLRDADRPEATSVS